MTITDTVAPLALTEQTPAQIDTALLSARDTYSAGSQRIEMLTKRKPRGWQALVAELEVAVTAAHATIVEYEAEFDRRGGWTRAYLVPGGHVHSSRVCASCHKMGKTTELLLQPAVSGADEELIIDKAGKGACTLCYPNAPVDPRKPNQFDEARHEQRRRELAENRAAAAAKAAAAAIVAVDGTPLIDAYDNKITTERAAQSAAVESLERLLLYPETHFLAPHWRDFADRAIAALAAKRGVDPAALAEQLRAKAIAGVTKVVIGWRVEALCRSGSLSEEAEQARLRIVAALAAEQGIDADVLAATIETKALAKAARATAAAQARAQA